MKNIFTPLLIAALITGTASAHDNHTTPTGLEKGEVVKQDKVKADLSTPAGDKDTEIFDRKVTRNGDGTYAVVITNDKGTTRMTGRYLDEELRVADGEFTYYHKNGTVESKGSYANGMKTGTWERFAEDGTRKAERNYTGMSWEDMAVQLGMASQAETR